MAIAALVYVGKSPGIRVSGQVPVSSSPSTSCAILGGSLNLSEPSVLLLKSRNETTPTPGAVRVAEIEVCERSVLL